MRRRQCPSCRGAEPLRWPSAAQGSRGPHGAVLAHTLRCPHCPSPLASQSFQFQSAPDTPLAPAHRLPQPPALPRLLRLVRSWFEVCRCFQPYKAVRRPSHKCSRHVARCHGPCGGRQAHGEALWDGRARNCWVGWLRAATTGLAWWRSRRRLPPTPPPPPPPPCPLVLQACRPVPARQALVAPQQAAALRQARRRVQLCRAAAGETEAAAAAAEPAAQVPAQVRRLLPRCSAAVLNHNSKPSLLQQSLVLQLPPAPSDLPPPTPLSQLPACLSGVHPPACRRRRERMLWQPSPN
jgi:hypothetical protein